VAGTLAKALCARVVVVRFGGPATEAAPGGSRDNVDPAVAPLEREGLEVSVRRYIGRIQPATIPLAFRTHSLIVVGGRRGVWSTPSARSRRLLEAAGHFVILADIAQSEPSHA
jgi:hypothetical protein